MAAERTLVQPELMIVGQGEGSQAVIIEEKQVLLVVDGCGIIEGLIHVTLHLLRTTYLCKLPKIGQTTCTCIYTLVYGGILSETVIHVLIRKPVCYSSLVNSVVEMFLDL